MVSGIAGPGGVYDIGGVQTDSSSVENTAVIKASAAEYTGAEISFGSVHADVIKTVIDYKAIKGSPDIYIYVGKKKVKKLTYKQLKAAGGKVNIYNDGSKRLKAGKKYKITVRTQYKDGTKIDRSKSTTLPTYGYWTVHKGAVLYTKKDGVLKKAYTAGSELVYRGVAVDKNFKKVSGKDKSTKAKYLKITVPVETGVNSLNEMQYKDKTYYVKFKTGTNISRKTIASVRNKVVNYAIAMTNKSSQKYELSGEYVDKNSTISDCSGLAELSYLQVGYYLEHYSDAQANNYGYKVYDNTVPAGTEGGTPVYTWKDKSARVDYSKLKKGDLFFFMCENNSKTDNTQYTTSLGLGHVGMYIGNGKMAHFTSGYGIYNHPCRVEDLASYEKNHYVVAVVTRVVY